jgi:ADP-heptose:LPS heptosyltransferase
MSEKRQHILVIRLSSMGDVAMTVPILELLLEQHPNLNITFVSRPKFEAFFKHLPRVNFFAADVDIKYRGVFGIYKLAKELSTLKADAVADLHDVLRTKILKFFLRLGFSGQIKTIDKGRAEKKKLCANNPNKELYQIKNTFERYAEVFEKLGYKIDLSKDRFKPSVPLTDNTAELLSIAANKIPIGIAPFARYKAKTYPFYLMEKMIKELLECRSDLHVFLFGAESDFENLSQLKIVFPNKISIVGTDLDLSEELGLISRLKLMLSMDSANMHLASMLSVPVVSLWGATHPCLGFYGWGQNPNNAICADRNKFPTLPCSVNGSKVHPGTENCMETIEPSFVIQKIIENL